MYPLMYQLGGLLPQLTSGHQVPIEQLGRLEQYEYSFLLNLGPFDYQADALTTWLCCLHRYTHHTPTTHIHCTHRHRHTHTPTTHIHCTHTHARAHARTYARTHARTHTQTHTKTPTDTHRNTHTLHTHTIIPYLLRVKGIVSRGEGSASASSTSSLQRRNITSVCCNQ